MTSKFETVYAARFGARRTCQPEMVAGRKVWVARDGFGGGAAPRVWVHATPRSDAALFFEGRSLDEGSATENADYLAHLCADTMAKWPAMPAYLARQWDTERTSAEADEAELQALLREHGDYDVAQDILMERRLRQAGRY